MPIQCTKHWTMSVYLDAVIATCCYTRSIWQTMSVRIKADSLFGFLDT